MSKINIFKLLLLSGVMTLFSNITYADTNADTESVYLTQILNQLNAIKPLIVTASKVEPASNRIQFHCTSFKTIDGVTHPGLLDDINQIEAGITDQLNHVALEPRVLPPIHGDYM